MSTTTTMTIGHRDPRITYKGDWDHGGLWTENTGESVSFSSTTDHNAFLLLDNLDFLPGNIFYYGFMQPRGGKISLCIDCRFFANSIHINPISPNSSPDAGPVVLYSGPTGGGSIIMTNRETLNLNASAPFSKLTFVRFELTRGASSTLSSVMPNSSGGKLTTAGNSSHPSNDPSLGQSNDTFPLGPLLGGVLGGLTGISLIVFIFWYYIILPRRQRNDTPPVYDDLVSPFADQPLYQAILPGRREMVGGKMRDSSHGLPSRTLVQPSKVGPIPQPSQSAVVLRGKGSPLRNTVTQTATQTIHSKFSGSTSTQSYVAAQHRPQKFDRV